VTQVVATPLVAC